MNLWILRIFPYSGGAPLEGMFRTESRAMEIWERAKNEENGCEFVDDFGIRVIAMPGMCGMILTNSDASAAMASAMHNANSEALHKYNMTPGLGRGSSVQ